MLNFIFKKASLMQSSDDENVFYICIGKKRFIFRHGTYTGWYKP